ncbi:phosphoribosylformylglycinamidine cyclo-ligase [Thermotomaculum hydrothermale]|uniref:Phosphoribosylformylglycinamidine cyclo-ligase n=1 Tax=Thermotomaculum hydrothermale TaxID=981385 RepID=A0A7R6PNP5_9BACT|nr:phosphoribosylformylglycinamidine cyclo-ligase [Thermotomaculum hydrothermale]BBB32948.1 phosphoribosylformylglycinamidine cyclo-ligase [Thermotomaculum hydrothermale]
MTNENSKYKEAGVNIDEQDKAISRIKKIVASTFTSNVLTGIGSFGTLFQIPEGYTNPVLVSSCDGVGTKLKVAFMTGIHDTVGEDLVNHCVNDIFVQGAKPLYFLDYIATGKLKAGVIEDIVSGLARGCKNNEMSLIGGEMAEMPGFYSEGEYDIAGFITGIVEKDKVITGENIKPGDLILGFKSTGLHTNGYSLARKIIFEDLKLKVDDYVEDLGCTVGEELLKVHKSYYPILKEAVEEGIVNGMAHITGGGFLDNIPRVLPDNCDAIIKKDRVPVLPVFNFLVENGNVSKKEAYRVFNMGIGMVCIVSPENIEKFYSLVKEEVFEIGVIESGFKKVVLI